MDSEMLDTEAAHGTLATLHQGRLWSDEGWRAQVLKHLGHQGWIVPICRRGDAKSIPALPWVTGCDKNDPRPLNMATINVLVRATGEAPCRAVQREYAPPHKNVTVVAEGESNIVRVGVAPGHDEPPGMLAANNCFGEQRASAKVQLSLDAGGTSAWIESRYPAPH